jgi:anaerobic magnesium-protoporphyrin IX monomethyl ester cyclase
MKVALLSPPLIGYRGDMFGHIPSIPIGILYVAAAARQAGHEVKVVDAFLPPPAKPRPWLGQFELAGLMPDEVVDLVPPDTEVIGLSAHSGLSCTYLQEVISPLRARSPRPRIVVGGAFGSSVPEVFLSGGADYVVVGEGEHAFVGLLDLLDGRPAPEGVKIDGGLVEAALIDDLDGLPFPAYDLIDIGAYKRAGRAHGPLRGQYLPLITSRGCPYDCAFCSTPRLSRRQWRPRSPESVVSEVQALGEKFSVTDFHIQDDNFTTNPERVSEICRQLSRLPIPVSFCLPSGVRVDNFPPRLLEDMAAAGLRFIAFSPESGSAEVRERIGKPVDIGRLRELVATARRLGVATQACFVIGFPGETPAALAQTRDLFRDLVRRGVSDVSFFIMAPVPGSRSEGSLGQVPFYEGYCWSPTWRPDYEMLSRFRQRRYMEYFLLRLAYHPVEFAGMVARALAGVYRSKGEMTLGWWLRRAFIA